MKQFIKNTMFSLSPRYANELFSARGRAHAHRIYREWGCDEINKAVEKNYGNKVLAGPFKGVQLTSSVFVEHISPYLLGTYEQELHKAWELVFTGEYRQILDIGAKFGFYATGLALRFPEVPVIAFDTDPWARRVTREVAKLNQADKFLKIESLCNPDWLRKKLLHDSFIISDCEGYEAVLFNGTTVANMETATLIIETHDHEVPGVTKKLTEHFSRSHKITLIPSAAQPHTCPVDLSFLDSRQQRLAVSDERPQQSWLLALPNAGQNASLAGLL